MEAIEAAQAFGLSIAANKGSAPNGDARSSQEGIATRVGLAAVSASPFVRRRKIFLREFVLIPSWLSLPFGLRVYYCFAGWRSPPQLCMKLTRFQMSCLC